MTLLDLQLDTSKLERRTEFPVPPPDHPVFYLLLALAVFWVIAWAVAGWHVGKRRGKPQLGAALGIVAMCAVSLSPFVSKLLYGAILVALVGLIVPMVWVKVPPKEDPPPGTSDTTT